MNIEDKLLLLKEIGEVRLAKTEQDDNIIELLKEHEKALKDFDNSTIILIGTLPQQMTNDPTF